MIYILSDGIDWGSTGTAPAGELNLQREQRLYPLGACYETANKTDTTMENNLREGDNAAMI